MQKSYVGNLNIFDLPEQIFRRIFSYLDEHDLHVNLRKTCKKLKQFVHSYVEWENALMLAFGNIDHGTQMELLHIIKYTSKSPHYYIKAAYPDIPGRSRSRIRFAAIIRKQIVIGVDHCDYYNINQQTQQKRSQANGAHEIVDGHCNYIFTRVIIIL